MFERPLLAVVALGALAAGAVWARSARRLGRVVHRLDQTSGVGSGAASLARTSRLRDLHAALLYGVVALVAGVASFARGGWVVGLALVLVVPVAGTLATAARVATSARLAEARASLEQRAAEVLAQEALAPRRWAARLAPDEPPAVAGFELGSLYRAGTGMMAGDFYDVFRTGPTRVAAVIGDVTGHGIEPSITAFQTKYLLRVFLRQFRDPGQALEELNAQMSGMGRGEEFISLCLVVFDTGMGTLRYASAGHPPAFVLSGGDVRNLAATGPLISLDPEATYASRELPVVSGDTVLLYTDGLAEARAGEQLFGEERIAALVRRDPRLDPDVLCKTLVEAAEGFATTAIGDDIALLAIRRT